MFLIQFLIDNLGFAFLVVAFAMLCGYAIGELVSYVDDNYD